MIFRSSIARLTGAAVLGAILGAPFIPAMAAVSAKHLAPIPAETVALMTARDTTPAAPILVRSYKKEAELEIWKRNRSGRYVLLKTFPICRWSGQLGPKTQQGDRQTPEGFYSIAPGQMNPNSSYYLSFDLGFPNAYDRAHGASGAFLMVHGTCSSAGCYAMTDKGVGEIYAIAREAFAGGQKSFQFQAFPFRMTAQNIARHRSDPNIDFWRQLKEGSDRFEATGEEPAVGVAGGRYVFAPSKDAEKEALAKARVSDEKANIATLIAEGSASVRTTYADGGQHPSFAALLRRGVSLGEVSRPEALALAGREVVITRARPKQTADARNAAPQPSASIVLAALTPEYIPLFAPVPLSDPMRAAPSAISGSMRILAPTWTSLAFEVKPERIAGSDPLPTGGL